MSYKTQMSCMLLISISVMIFYLAYYHHQRLQYGELSYAENVARITSFLSTKQVPDEPVWTSSGYTITEERAILFVFIASAFLSLISFFVLLLDRIKNGKNRFFIPIVFASTGTIACILFTAYRIGLYHYA